MTEELLPVAVILFLVEFVRGAYLISFLPAYSTGQLGMSVTIVGAAVTSHYIMDTMAKSLLGYLLDRFSSRRVVHWGLLVSFFGLLLTYYAQQTWVLILAAAIYGIGISPVWIVALSRARETDRATQMGALYTLWLVGLGLGPILINFLLDESYSASFWIMAGFWMTGWLLSLRIPDQQISSIDSVSFVAQCKALWERLKAMKPLLPGMVLQTTAAGMLVPILPGFATKHVGLTYTQYSYVLLAGGVCAVLGLIPMGRLSDRRGKKWFLVFGFGIFAFALYALTLGGNLYTSILWAMVLGLSYAAVLPVWNAILSYQVPDGQRGLGWGIFSSVEGIGVMIGPVLGGWIADLYGETITILFSAALLGGIAVFYLLLPFSRLTGERRIS